MAGRAQVDQPRHGDVNAAPLSPATSCLKTRHIVFVLAGLSAGGAERVVSLIAGRWVADGHRVTIVTFDHATDPAFHRLDPRIRVVRLGVRAGGGRLAAGVLAVMRRLRALRRALDQLDPDITISFLTKINVLSLLAGLGRRRRLIVCERNNPRLQGGNRLWRWLFAALQGRADAIVMQTRASLDTLREAGRARAHLIYNPITIEPIPARDAAAPILAAVGRLTPQKGFDLLVEAFAPIAGRHPQWTLVIWGEGECRNTLELQVEALGLGGRVRLPGISRSPNEWVGRADAFVLSSRYEGFGNALAEGMAGGLAVVAFDCDYGPAEIIHDGEDGILVRNGDVPALASALDRLLGSSELRARLGRSARITTRRFEPAAIISEWNRVLADVVSR